MSDKQAVVLIHGIGEQPPMQTLRRFVEAVWTRNSAIQDPHAGGNVWSKPDEVSESFELRRLTTPQNLGSLRTDFFEFYWAHLMEGTSFGHVWAWAKTLLFRRPKTVPKQLKPVYWLSIGILVLAAILALVWYITVGENPIPAWLSAILGLTLVPAVGFFIKSVVGDAARYLHVAPPNVQSRHAIRTAGVKLLEELHKREYTRIIVVGHSLGSVIGYDVLTYAWAAHHDKVSYGVSIGTSKMDALEALEEIARHPPPENQIGDVQKAQRKYFDELEANGNSWRVTDFVTLGSPLAHAAILLADDMAAFGRKKDDREFPSCLPVLEASTEDHQEVRRFSFKLERRKKDGYRVPHHAAVFAPTRWSNLYFENRFIVGGDLIGGPLRPVFGSGIRDVKMSTTENGGYLSHTLYWSLPAMSPKAAAGEEPDVAPDHVRHLREALDLTDERAQ